MPLLYDVSVVLHVLAGIVWIGGTLFVGAVALPAARTLPDDVEPAAVSAIARRFRIVGWTAIGVSLVTGTIMIGYWGAHPGNLLDGSFFQTPRTQELALKLAAVGLMLVVSGTHDWWVGPRAARLAEAEAPEASTWRTWAAILGVLTALLVVAVAVCAVALARPWLTLV